MTPSQRHNALLKALECTYLVGWLRRGEPAFRHWDKLPAKERMALRELKSDDIKNAMVRK
jgi:hypothetical protein